MTYYDSGTCDTCKRVNVAIHHCTLCDTKHCSRTKCSLPHEGGSGHNGDTIKVGDRVLWFSVYDDKNCSLAIVRQVPWRTIPRQDTKVTPVMMPSEKIRGLKTHWWIIEFEDGTSRFFCNRQCIELVHVVLQKYPDCRIKGGWP